LISPSAAWAAFTKFAALARRPLLGGLDALVAGIRSRVDLTLEFLHHRLRRHQMPIQRRLAPERGCPRTGPYPHPVLRQRAEIDEFGLGQRRQVLGEQPVEQIGTADPKVAQRVMVYRHASAQPAIGIMAVA
jgi:hypothetical protein